MKRFVAVLILFVGLESISMAGTALIVYNNSSLSTTQSNLTTILTNLGNTVTSVNTSSASLPSLSGITQVWDIRQLTALSGSETTDYVAYLSGGGALFLMGENTGYAGARDTSIISFISTAGGGTVTIPSNLMSAISYNLNSPFTGPISISTMTLHAAGIFGGLGSGSAIAQDGSGNIPAAYWQPGTLANATSGTLIVVLDVNFLQTQYLQSDFTSNMSSYLASPTPAPSAVPTLSEWSQMLLGLLVMTLIGWHFHHERLN